MYGTHDRMVVTRLYPHGDVSTPQIGIRGRVRLQGRLVAMSRKAKERSSATVGSVPPDAHGKGRCPATMGSGPPDAHGKGRCLATVGSGPPDAHGGALCSKSKGRPGPAGVPTLHTFFGTAQAPGTGPGKGPASATGLLLETDLESAFNALPRVFVPEDPSKRLSAWFGGRRWRMRGFGGGFRDSEPDFLILLF